MRNLETATLKLGIFHPHDSLSQALIAAALQRQIEVSALQADLNSLQARPGLRCK
ncbi:NAD-dependent epimerase, partial [Pseudomonas aeruginosa]|nr:NAD-dependent epimerase [Pseudomonas aeruginosa]MCF3999117.1 NAD-dependent epimerase [Pseudomonas aeruginosa]